MTGFSAQIALVPEKRFGLVVLMNGDGVVLTKTIDAALRAVAGVLPFAGEPLPAGEPVAEDEARSLAGRYLNRWPLELSWADGALRLRWGGAVREVRRLGPGRYVAGGAGEAGATSGSPAPAIELRVGRSSNGTVYVRQFLWAFGRDYLPAAAREPEAQSTPKK